MLFTPVYTFLSRYYYNSCDHQTIITDMTKHPTTKLSNATANPNTVNKRIQSYNRLLNAGIIKKDVFDNRIQKLSNSNPPSTHSHTNNNNNNTASSSSNKTMAMAPSVNKNNNNNNNNNKQQCNTTTTTWNANKAPTATIATIGPISNLSGQYPINGSPGRLLR
jgi:hypothetical protein